LSPGGGSPYRVLAEFYEILFPLGTKQEAFLSGLVSGGGVRTALDVGAAAGTHLAWLSSRGIETAGLEPDPDLFRRLESRDWPGSPPSLLREGFSALPLPGRSFALVLCLGNTLPHAPDRERARLAVAGMLSSTAPGGRLCLQTVNFDAVVARGTWEFPPIVRKLPDGRQLELHRSYDPAPLPDAVDFRVSLSLDGVTSAAQTRLLALRSGEILGWLDGAGAVECHGDYDRTPFTPQSPAFVVTVRRNR
jgi:SAM-dependent methyltransferase